jgi:hypothetical protein
MKKLLLSAAAIAAMSTGAFATDQNINLSASVAKFCTIGGSLTPSAISQAIGTTTTGGVTTTALTVPIGAVVCNSASSVQLKSTNGALIGGPTATGFENYINYTASVSLPTAASVTANSVTGGSVAITGTAANTTGATSDAAVSVTITPTANTLPLTAFNAYADILTVTISPL